MSLANMASSTRLLSMQEWTPLHEAAESGDVDKVRELLEGGKYDVNCVTWYGWTPLHLAASEGHLGVIRVLLSEFKADVNARSDDGETPLLLAASEGHLDVVRVFLHEFKADVNACTHYGSTPLDVAVYSDCEEVALALINYHEFHYTRRRVKIYIRIACRRGWVNLVQALIQKHGTGILKHVVRVNLVEALIEKHGTFILEYMHVVINKDDTPFDVAVKHNSEELAVALMNEFYCSTKGGTPYIHTACRRGWVNLVRALVQKHGANIMNYKRDVTYHNEKAPMTPLQKIVAERSGHEVAVMLVKEFGSIVKDLNGLSLLHLACTEGDASLVHKLIHDGKADVTARDYQGQSPLHIACIESEVSLVRTLIVDGEADITARDDDGNTPLHLAAMSGREDVVYVLVNEFGCDRCIKGYKGRQLLHSVCAEGDKRLVPILILDHKADITARDDEGNTPLHVAALSGSEDVVLTLINEFSCDVNVTGRLGRSLLHSACASNNGSLVRLVGQHISPWVVDDNGNTPLHICASLGNTESVKALLELNPPVLARNNFGQAPRDLEETHGHTDVISAYMRGNKHKIYSHYEVVQRHAKKKYSLPEPITRAFVVGNPGAGKSSLVEALKREGLFDWLWRVSESSVPPHTAGIVPSIHTSKHYGRVLFYDFAGDAEYYSSHAAILENLASSRKGDNVFVLVIDMREEMAEIRKVFYYWLSFIQHQQFHGQKPYLIVIGSHSDLLTENMAKTRGKEFQMFCGSIHTEAVQMSALFMLDCCKPGSKQIVGIQTLMSGLTKDSPRFKLTLQASTLLGLLEIDFSNVPACSTKVILSHVKETGIQLLAKKQSFYSILLELHDLGLLFLIGSGNTDCSSVVLNMSQLTNIVHKSLFSKEAVLKETFEKEGLSFSFSAGIVPQSILAKILPENITKECLVQLQYCQVISHAEAHIFPSLKVSDSTDQSFLFFPALCSADKSEIAWVTPPDLSYGIGWLARCTDPCDYLSPRFHHVLMLRLVFKFTLSAHPPADQVSSGSPDLRHFQRRCTVWKTGVHWLMEEGVECMVELAGANREVAVLTKSTKDRAENCTTVFNNIVSCVMEAKAEFCHSVRQEFFLLDSTSEADYLSADNLFAMRDVERVLTSAESKLQVIVSASGKRQMERSKLLCLCNFTLWHSLFPMDIDCVLHYIKDIVEELYMLCLNLNIPKSTFDELEARYFTEDPDKMRRELVKVWMSSSLDPPCWWHLVTGLHAINMIVLAEEIATEFGKS